MQSYTYSSNRDAYVRFQVQRTTVTDCDGFFELHKTQCLNDASFESRFSKIHRTKKQKNCPFVLVFRKQISSGN